MVKITDYSVNQQQCRTILDSGSQASFITEACVRRLGLKRSKANVSVVGIGQTGSGTSRGLVTLQVGSNSSNFTTSVTAFIMNKLTSHTPQQFVDAQQWSHLENIRLADVTFGKPGEVDIILGADIFSELLLEGKILGHGTLPSAFNTHFGWVISGKISSDNQQRILVNFANVEVQDQLKQFWELEEIIPKRQYTAEEGICESHFMKTHSRDSSGRFQVSLPFGDCSESLGSSKEMALKRLLQVERRLNHRPQCKEKYHKFLEEYLELGHMEVIPMGERVEVVGTTNYLPHHFVLKEDSTTTSLRVVFDASAKTSSGISLNNKLAVGPKLQDDIWDILLRFRLHKIAFTADVAKMYRQIMVSSSDADLQRILWRSSPTDPIDEYRITTVAFGTASAPYLATKVLQTLAHTDGESFPLAREVALRDFYVDDLMSGASSVSEALNLQSQIIAMLQQGGFQLRKWSSNDPALLESLPEELRETKLPLKIGSDDSIKALGLHWHPANDHLFFVVHLGPEIGDLSKRSILSDVARLYDPLGLLAPVTIIAKCLIQKLWTAGVSWDDKIPPHLENEWLRFRGQLAKLEDLKIHRCITGNNSCSYQLHGFADASELAYGAVVVSQRGGNGRGAHSLCKD